jgi:hypothetical protein
MFAMNHGYLSAGLYSLETLWFPINYLQKYEVSRSSLSFFNLTKPFSVVEMSSQLS